MRRGFIDKFIILSVGILIFSGCTKKQNVKSPEEREKLPNIIYVLADDLGYGDIKAFNTEGKISTPNIDRLALEGMKFTDAHSSSAVCTPTRYSILTGRYNWRSNLKSSVLTGKSKALIPSSRVTVASLLKQKNYNTAFIGKWHLGWDWAQKGEIDKGGAGWDEKDFDNIDFSKPITNSPNDLGFDYFYGHSGSLDMAPYVYVENNWPTQIPDSTTVNTGKYSWWRKGPTSKDFIHDDVTPNFFRRSISFIGKKAKEENPFFLYLALPSPHTPILPTEDWAGKSGLNPYADFMMMIDDYMGLLLEAVQEAGIEENTIVIFTSDNGCSPMANFELLKEKGHDPSAGYRGHKADIFEGGHHVPFVVRWPKKIKPSTTTNKTICTTDFYSTCAEIANISLKENEGEDSFSLLPLFQSSDSDKFMREATVHHSINGSFAIRKGDWKLIFCDDSGGWSDPKPNDPREDNLPKFQLYDLSKDKGERNNLYGNYPELEEELEKLMISYIENGRSTIGPNVQNEPGYKNTWKQLEVFNKN